VWKFSLGSRSSSGAGNSERAAGGEVTVAGDRASPDSRGPVSPRRWFQRLSFGISMLNTLISAALMILATYTWAG
jgi:hypothetical protein